MAVGFQVVQIGGGWFQIIAPDGRQVRRCRGRSRAEAWAAIYQAGRN